MGNIYFTVYQILNRNACNNFLSNKFIYKYLFKHSFRRIKGKENKLLMILIYQGYSRLFWLETITKIVKSNWGKIIYSIIVFFFGEIISHFY